ncbi:electron transfer flavoprotein subunit alpha/FixB family protein [Acidianus infernus]|uniref:Electron transfer flavoprotein subunit alpha/FixB family protein n=1 Tax=Acidianus infernus TaxID=12915 RepID=A0A6A9Q941_ACIIN|nr:electron transfer flavoprotein subunit alpha/FixB family protein [Acidianus infernus]MUM63731.1 electron transfer flavoprotein subunit alpha/FixB family protein [Acidianus infernus]
MKVVIYSEDPEIIKAGASYFPKEYIIGITTREVKYADELYLVDKIDEEFISNFITSLKPDVVLVGNSKRDKTIAGYVAGLLKVPIIPEVMDLEGNKAKRVVYSGMGIAEIEFSYPAVIIIGRKEVQVKEKEKIKINKLEVKEGRVKILEEKSKGEQGVNLSTAEIIVSVGRGIGSKENVKYAEDLANALGAALGGSRPVTAELGWLPEDRQIGLSGNKVKPKLYIALGISGQPQHLAGIKDAKIIVAVNKDKNAPIAENADYTIVGDAIEFCKIMSEKVKNK